MTDLVDFLLARFDEDERFVVGVDCVCAMIQRPDCPARIVAECEAKRRIVIEESETGREDYAQILVTIYADHPDYDAKWVLS